MTISAGAAADELNLDAFIAQGMDYSEGGGGLERLTKLLQDLRVTHPMPVRRVRMLLDWVREGEYDRMVRGDYLRRGEEPPLSEEAEAAGAFYGDRIAGAFQAAGSSVSDVGQQLGDWLNRNRGSGERLLGPRQRRHAERQQRRPPALVELRVDDQQATRRRSPRSWGSGGARS